MARYFMKRVAVMAVAMFLIIPLTFAIMHAVPGGLFTGEKRLSTEIGAAINEKYHLNDPLPLQLIDYLKGVIHEDFGSSYKYPGRTVNEFIVDGFPTSTKLGSITIVFVLLAALPMGICAAVKNRGWQDMLVIAFATVGVTIPSFVITSFLVYFFAFKLGLLPTYGVESWKEYILPVIALGGYDINYIAQLMRGSLLEVMGQDYTRTTRAKRPSEFSIITNHALQNALIPIITVLGPVIANLMADSFVVERILAILGLRVRFVNSVSQKDYTAIMGVIIFYATFLMVMTMVADVFYCLIDPRIRYD